MMLPFLIPLLQPFLDATHCLQAVLVNNEMIPPSISPLCVIRVSFCSARSLSTLKDSLLHSHLLQTLWVQLDSFTDLSHVNEDYEVTAKFHLESKHDLHVQLNLQESEIQ